MLLYTNVPKDIRIHSVACSCTHVQVDTERENWTGEIAPCTIKNVGAGKHDFTGRMSLLVSTQSSNFRMSKYRECTPMIPDSDALHDDRCPTAAAIGIFMDFCCYYHNGYCLCAVTGRSSKGTHTLLFFLFCSLSSSRRIRVASSLRRTVIPAALVSKIP